MYWWYHLTKRSVYSALSQGGVSLNIFVLQSGLFEKTRAAYSPTIENN